ncbi:MAG TPA: alpha-ribazole phosphatase [Clostridia bacterium]|nr:alpha-ribazole phosphatase [Clostridia bacterium]
MRKIYLVRHGETNANVEKRYCGQTDVDLNHKGLRDAASIAKVLKNTSLDSIVSSDLKRTLKTAELINEYHRLELELNPDFREINFGKFENLTFEEIGVKYPDEKAKMIKEKINYNFLEGESLSVLYKRVIKSFNKLLEEKENENILIVSHGGVIRMILTEILSGDLNNYWSVEVDNTRISTIVDHEGFLYLKNLNRKVL